jgi:hypothetical protein
MPLFNNVGETYTDEPNRLILARMEAFYNESISNNLSFWTEADVDTRFETGDQSAFTAMYGLTPLARHKQFSFNRIRRVVNMISGHQRRNRKSTIVTPVENGDELTADQYTKLLMWVNQQEGVLETLSESFHGALVTGMNLLQVWVDYRSDPVSGNIKVDNCPYNSFLIDPFFRKPDLSDCNGLWKRSFLTRRECLSLLPGQSERIMELQLRDHRDGKFQFTPENYGFSMKHLLAYDEFWYRDYRPQKMLIDTNTGESIEWKIKDDESLGVFLGRFPSLTVIEQEVPTVRLAIVVQGHVLYDGPNPMGTDQYPFVPVFAYYNPQIPYFPQRVQGVVRGLRDPQYLYNRRKAIEFDILESQPNSGYIYKENALVNPKDIFLSGQGRGLALKEEAQMTDVQQIMPPQIPPSMVQLSEIMAREVMEISGVNEELLGSASDDKAGVLSMLRQGAGLTTLQGLFDQLDHSQRLLGRLMLNIIQANFMPGKVKRIITEEPSPQFYNKTFGTYDAAIEEDFNTTTQRQMNFAQLLQLREVGVLIPDHLLLDAATVQNKVKLMEAVQQNVQSQEEAQQAQAQMQLKLQESQIKLTESTIEANEGIGMERTSRVIDNQAQARERDAQAQRDRESGLLDLVKAFKEIEGMDIKHITEMLNLAATLKQPAQQPLETEPAGARTEPQGTVSAG